MRYLKTLIVFVLMVGGVAVAVDGTTRAHWPHILFGGVQALLAHVLVGE